MKDEQDPMDAYKEQAERNDAAAYYWERKAEKLQAEVFDLRKLVDAGNAAAAKAEDERDAYYNALVWAHVELVYVQLMREKPGTAFSCTLDETVEKVSEARKLYA